MRKLYEIRNDIWAAVEYMIFGEEMEETPPPIEDIEIEATEKIRNCVWAINRLSAEEAEADLVIKQAQAYKKKRTEAIARIKDDIKLTMEVMGLDKIDEPDCKASLGKPKPVVEILDKSIIPDEYMRIKSEPNKTEILTALKNGVTIEGVKLGLGQPSLTIPKIKGE